MGHLPDVLPKADLIRYGQLLSGHKLDDTGTLQSLDIDKELIPWFNELKAKYPADFSVTPQQARAWRENEIAQCMKEGNLPAAFFHRDWLIAEMVQQAAASKGK